MRAAGDRALVSGRPVGRRLAWVSYRAVNAVLDRAEALLADGSDRPLPHAPILIVGAPRSGTTLLYQVLTEGYDVGYISNLHCHFFGAPSVIENTLHPLRWRRRSDFCSVHGRTKGLAAPSECGQFWYRFFRRKPQAVRPDEFSPDCRRRLRGAVRRLTSAFDRPVAFKNVMCSVRLEATACALPEALFIVVRRDLADNARSVLTGRFDAWGDYDRWWSLEPPNVGQLKLLPPAQQAVEQVRGTYAAIDAARGPVGVDRFIDVSYEELCADPKAALQRVAGSLGAHGVALRYRDTSLPERFERRRSSPLPPQLDEELESCIANIQHPSAVTMDRRLDTTLLSTER